MKSALPYIDPTSIFVEALEPRIAPAGLLNEAKLTSVTLGTPQLLDASGGPNDFQGLTTGVNGSGSVLLYITAGKALVYTSDLNGNGRFDPGEITGIAAGVDSLGRPLDLLLFSDVHGDIVTNLLPGHGVSQLTDSDNNPANGRDGRVLLDNAIHSITLRTLTASDLDQSLPGNTLANRVALTSFSIFGNIYTGGDFGGTDAGLTIDTSGESNLVTQFNGLTNNEQFTAAAPQVGGIYTGSAAGGQEFHFTQVAGNNVVNGIPQPGGNAFEGTLLPFTTPANEHGGDITGVRGDGVGTLFDIGSLETGAGGFNARGGNISDVTMHGDHGGYSLVAGDGGQGPTGAPGGSIIDFSDLSSVTSVADLHTGSGGAGLLGVGGTGGTATFGTVKIAADVNLILGDGGSGFTAGGAGASLPAAKFTAPEGSIDIGGQFLGTYHAIGDVGNTHPLSDGTYGAEAINFNPVQMGPNGTMVGDNFGDGVYTTSGPDQIVVVFGDGAGGLLNPLDASNGTNPNSIMPSDTIRLHAPGLIDPIIVVGDFNGDGKPDIAAVSNGPDNFGGVYIFLNQINDPVHNPLGAQNYSRNPLGAHPFSTALQSAVPTLSDQGYYVGAGPISALAAGDYNGDGVLDLAYVQQVTRLGNPGSPTTELVGVLFGSPVRTATGAVLTSGAGHPAGTVAPVGSGYFFANLAGPTDPANLQTSAFSTLAVPILKATSLSSHNLVGSPNAATGVPTNPEVFFYGAQGQTSIALFGVTTNELLAGAGLTELGSVSLGSVDTNRLLGATNISLTQAFLEDYSVQDLDNDGNADVVALTSTPFTFLITFHGNANGGGFALESGSGDNAGLFLGSQSTPGTAVTATDAGQSGQFGAEGVLLLPNNTSAEVDIFTLVTGTTFATSVTPSEVATIPLEFNDADLTVRGLDNFFTVAPNYLAGTNLHAPTGFGVLTPTTKTLDTFLEIAGTYTTPIISYFVYETDNGFKVFSGNGGNSLIGAGGAAGSIGTGVLGLDTTDNVLGSVSFVFPSYPAYEGNTFLSGGHGGNGFTSGGVGGDVTSVSARDAILGDVTSDVQFVAGNGGNGISADGGRGGILSELSVLGATFFSGGNGGTGLHGGAGGSVLGNAENTYDTQAGDVTILTGGGGGGPLGGGNGGNITNFDAIFLGGGSLAYVTGPGGSAAGGSGGNGGNITNSSPDANVNLLDQDITLFTGAGGAGLGGGSGGNITNFSDLPNSNFVPSQLNVVTGPGGSAVDGTGGAGGTISNVQVTANGLPFGNTNALSGTVRILAGNGGVSLSGTGGAGGAILDTTVTATSTPLVAAAGAGGDGLIVGGAGGSVSDSNLSSAGTVYGKMLIIGGAGGDATSVSRDSVILAGDADTTDLAHQFFALGGVNGSGGDGGSIANIIQQTGSATAVDIIAGNGGSTVNSGSVLDTSTGVGHGGSVTNINLVGTVGSITRDVVNGSNPAIRAYNDVNGDGVDDESIAAFIQASFDGSVGLAHTSDSAHFYIPNNPSFELTDAVGNVGIVAGEAGRVKGGQGAADGVNGSVGNITAGSILSIVAGSVNNVAPVSVLSGIVVTNPDGVLGADKSLPSSSTAGGPNGVLDYNPDPAAGPSTTGNLQPGFGLIDGALFALEVDQPATGPQIIGPRVFFTSQSG